MKYYLTLIMACMIAGAAVATPSVSYFVIKRSSYDAAVDAGMNPNVFAQKLKQNKGGAKLGLATCRKSNDLVWFIGSARNPGASITLKKMLDDWSIEYTEYDGPGIKVLTSGPNWTDNEEE